MNIYLYEDYKLFLKDYVEAQNKKGRGVVGRISEALNIHTSHVSTVLHGDKDFTMEQFYALSKFLELDPSESEHFLLLAQCSRAGSYDYQQYLLEKIRQSQQYALAKQKHFGTCVELSSEDQNAFYSSWVYPAVQLFCSTGEGKTFSEIQKRFHLGPKRLSEILDFLCQAKLCQFQNDRYTMNPLKTVINSTSPLWALHHKNWRLKSIEKSESVSANEILYTSAVTLSVEDFNFIRDMLLQLLRSLSTRIEASPSEELACLNIDWFLIK